MLVFIIALVTATVVTLIYLSASSTVVLSYTRIVALLITALLFGEASFGAASMIWDYLVATSFCPWIMVFRGRPSSTIIVEVMSHTNSLMHANNVNSVLSSLVGLSGTFAELIGGPALGIVITAAFVFIAYKCMAALFAKFFNRK